MRFLNIDPKKRIEIEEIKKSEFYLKGKEICGIEYEKKCLDVCRMRMKNKKKNMLKIINSCSNINNIKMKKFENNNKKNLINIQEKKKLNISDISAASASSDEDNKKFDCSQTIIGQFNLNNQNNDIFLQNYKLENDYQFTFDVKDMTYKQLKYYDQKINFYEKLKEISIKKIADAKKALKNEEEE
jgi:hypothetical protein